MLISMKQVINYTTLSRATINKYVRKGLFPPPLKLLDSNRIGFLKSEVDDWILARKTERDNQIATRALQE